MHIYKIKCNKIVTNYFIALYSTSISISNMVYLKYSVTVSKKNGNSIKRNKYKKIIKTIIQKFNLANVTKNLYINIIVKKPFIVKDLKILKYSLYYAINKILKC